MGPSRGPCGCHCSRPSLGGADPPTRTSLVTPQRLGPGFLPGSPVRPTPRTEPTSIPEGGPVVQGCPPPGSQGLVRPPCSHSSLVPLSCLTGPALLQGTASEGTLPGAPGSILLFRPSVPQTPQVQLGDSEGQQGTEGPRLGGVCPAGDAAFCSILLGPGDTGPGPGAVPRSPTGGGGWTSPFLGGPQGWGQRLKIILRCRELLRASRPPLREHCMQCQGCQEVSELQSPQTPGGHQVKNPDIMDPFRC